MATRHRFVATAPYDPIAVFPVLRACAISLESQINGFALDMAEAFHMEARRRAMHKAKQYHYQERQAQVCFVGLGGWLARRFWLSGVHAMVSLGVFLTRTQTLTKSPTGEEPATGDTPSPSPVGSAVGRRQWSAHAHGALQSYTFGSTGPLPDGTNRLAHTGKLANRYKVRRALFVAV